ncbi:MAG TPA: hypothetical protein DCR97_05945 [Deltaproteobacteria bacterium]|nr:hypothetical protein [Deltaproteobacteria bacterium]
MHDPITSKSLHLPHNPLEGFFLLREFGNRTMVTDGHISGSFCNAFLAAFLEGTPLRRRAELDRRGKKIV